MDRRTGSTFVALNGLPSVDALVMAARQRHMRVFPWPTDEGWPYPDQETVRLRDEWDEADDDLLNVRVAGPHLLDSLSPIERAVVTARFGLADAPVRTMKELRDDLGMPRDELRVVLGSALDKLRGRLTS